MKCNCISILLGLGLQGWYRGNHQFLTFQCLIRTNVVRAQLTGLTLSRLINGSFIFLFDRFLLQTMKVENGLPYGAKCASQGEALQGWGWRGLVNSATALHVTRLSPWASSRPSMRVEGYLTPALRGKNKACFLYCVDPNKWLWLYYMVLCCLRIHWCWVTHLCIFIGCNFCNFWQCSPSPSAETIS